MRLLWPLKDGLERPAQRGGIFGRHQRCHPVGQDVGHATHSCRHDGNAGRHSLEQHHRSALRSGAQHVDVKRGKVQAGVRDRAAPVHPAPELKSTCLFLQGGLFPSFPNHGHNDFRAGDMRERFEQDIQPLFPAQAPDPTEHPRARWETETRTRRNPRCDIRPSHPGVPDEKRTGDGHPAPRQFLAQGLGNRGHRTAAAVGQDLEPLIDPILPITTGESMGGAHLRKAGDSRGEATEHIRPCPMRVYDVRPQPSDQPVPCGDLRQIATGRELEHMNRDAISAKTQHEFMFAWLRFHAPTHLGINPLLTLRTRKRANDGLDAASSTGHDKVEDAQGVGRTPLRRNHNTFWQQGSSHLLDVRGDSKRVPVGSAAYREMR